MSGILEDLDDSIFVYKPDDSLKCRICLSVAINGPMQHEVCGKLFCSKCLERHGREKPCAHCREKGNYFLDKKSQREIMSLLVKCINVCNWQGPLSQLETHCNTCQRGMVPCPNECRDANNKVHETMRMHMAEHLLKNCPNRRYCCPYCEVEGTYISILQNHIEACPKRVLPCPNSKCTKSVMYADLQQHLSECKYTVVPCPYENIGCIVMAPRKHMQDHVREDTKMHLRLALEYQVRAIDQQRLERQEAITFKLADYQRLKNENCEFQTASFYTAPEGYHMSVKVYPNGHGEAKDTHVSVFLVLLDGMFDNQLKWPFTGKVTFSLLNQIQDNNHFNVTSPRADSKVIGSAWGHRHFIPHHELDKHRMNNSQYLKDDTLYFRVSVDDGNHRPWLKCTNLH